MERRSTKQDYNQHPLAVCDAKYFGRDTPQATMQGPEIILEPLRKLYSPGRHKRKDILAATTKSVKIIVYNSGIIIQQQVKSQKDIIDWYPIQNLYCSAGLKPDRTKKGEIIFKQFHESVKTVKHPVFAFVVREPGKDGRRVLMCHAFEIENVTSTQELVSACQHAYTHEAGWNHPISDKRFLDGKLSYAMQMVDEEVGLKKLRLETDERDKHLAKRPEIPPDTLTKPSLDRQTDRQIRSSIKHTRSNANRKSVRHAQDSFRQPQTSFRQPQTYIKKSHSPVFEVTPKIAQSSPATSRKVILTQSPRNYAVSNHTHSELIRPHSSRVPTPKAISYYQGFTSNAMVDGMNGMNGYEVETFASVGGVPLSRSSTGGMEVRSHQPTPEPAVAEKYVKPKRVSKSRRNHLAETSIPKGHRVLASSEPQELVNGYGNKNGIAIVDWDELVDESDIKYNNVPAEINGDVTFSSMNGDSSPTGKEAKHSKYHRPSRKTMETYSVENSANQRDYKGQRSSSQSSVKSDSSYSIINLQDKQTKPTINGFFEAHEHADQEL